MRVLPAATTGPQRSPSGGSGGSLVPRSGRVNARERYATRMRARAYRVAAESVERILGSILAADARGADGRVVLRRATRLEASHRATLAALAGAELHLVELDPGDLLQDEVALRLARAAAGDTLRVTRPEQGQVRLVATAAGVLRVRAAAVRAVNGSVALALFTRPDGEVVLAGDEVAGVKATALATSERVVATAEAAARGAVRIAPFERRRVAVLVTDRLGAKGRALVIAAIRRKVEWYGSELVRLSEVAHDAAAVASEFAASLAVGDLLLVSGANALDPLDPVFVALERLGGRIERTGVPAHPGSMAWIGRARDVPVLGVATCAGFGKNTSLDLLLARTLAGEDPVDAATVLGHGGLLEGDAAAGRFPPYGRSRPARLLDETEARDPVSARSSR